MQLLCLPCLKYQIILGGALGMGQMASTGLITFNNFWSQVTPLAGGYIADAYLGRFSTIVYSVYIILLGHIILIMSAIPQVIVNKPGALACFIISIIIMGIGAGGFKSNVLTLIAEQRDSRTYIRTEANGERVIVDPGLTVQRIYMVSQSLKSILYFTNANLKKIVVLLPIRRVWVACR